jgi:hypothetical protein
MQSRGSRERWVRSGRSARGGRRGGGGQLQAAAHDLLPVARASASVLAVRPTTPLPSRHPAPSSIPHPHERVDAPRPLSAGSASGAPDIQLRLACIQAEAGALFRGVEGESGRRHKDVRIARPRRVTQAGTSRVTEGSRVRRRPPLTDRRPGPAMGARAWCGVGRSAAIAYGAHRRWSEL